MAFTYTPDMPVATHLPSADQPIMNSNSQYLNAFGGKDHFFTQNSANANDGTHKQVTLTDETSPAPIATTSSVVYANAAGSVPQSQLFFKDAVGDVQLTAIAAAAGPSLAVPTIAAKGSTFLPGGLLIQWGTDTQNTAGFTTFATAFATNAYVVVLTPTAPTAAATNGLLDVIVKNANNFQISNATGNVQSYTYNWIAIGIAL